MKKLFTVLAIACVAMLFVSCHKDGVYTPNKKISEIYYTNEDGVRALDQVWTWNKDNTLNRIDIYEGATVYSSFVFTYEKKRVVRLDNATNDRFVEYEYEGDHLTKAFAYSGSIILEAYRFTYDKGKISKIVGTLGGYKSAEDHFNALQFVLPDEVFQSVEKTQKKHLAKGDIKSDWVETYDFTWTKNNITGLTVTITSGSGYASKVMHEYQYDNKKNPLYGAFINLWFDTDVYEGNLNSNNITRSISREEGEDDEIIDYQYTYKGQYPISRREIDGNETTLIEYVYVK